MGDEGVKMLSVGINCHDIIDVDIYAKSDLDVKPSMLHTSCMN